MPSFEGQLKTLKVVSLNPTNLNCVVTRDQAIHSTIFRASKSPEAYPSRREWQVSSTTPYLTVGQPTKLALKAGMIDAFNKSLTSGQSSSKTRLNKPKFVLEKPNKIKFK